jgi:hypothetical protein
MLLWRQYTACRHSSMPSTSCTYLLRNPALCGGWGCSSTILYPQGQSIVHTGWDARWPQEPVWTLQRTLQSLASTRNRVLTLRPSGISQSLYQLTYPRRIPSSGMSHHVALVRTNVSEEHITFIIRAERIRELGTTLAVTRNWYEGDMFLRNVS